MFSTLFLSVLNMSITASLVMVIVLVVRFLLKKSPKIFSYALWIVVLYRLICPFTFESAVSLLPINETPIPHDIVYSTEPQINTGLNIVDNAINPMLSMPNHIEESASPLQIWLSIASVIWVIGIVIMLVYSIYQLIKLKQKLIGAIPSRDNIYLADHIDSPFVMGVVRPKIYLPSSLSTTEQEFIIAHELHHMKRFDHITRILSFIALMIHWFNPFVWLAFILSGKDMEMSCDEAVMKKMNSDIRVAYSQSLLRFATGKKIITATPLAFGEGDTKERIKNVMKYKKLIIWVSAVAAMIVIGVAIGLMGNAKKEYLSDIEYNQIDKIQVINSRGNPEYGDYSKIITDENEISQFIDTFNNGIIGSKVKEEEVSIGFSSRYIFYKNGEVIADYNFNNINTSDVWWNNECRNIIYDTEFKTPFDLYEQSGSPIIIVDQDGNEINVLADDSDSTKGENEEESSTLDFEHFMFLSESNILHDVTFTATRTDENISIENHSPISVSEIANLQLSTDNQGLGKELVKPFIIEIEITQGIITFDFTTPGKVVVNGETEMYIGSQEGLDDFLSFDHSHFYTGDHFLFKDEIPFTVSDIVSVAIDRSHYTENITVVLTNLTAIETFYDRLTSTYVHRVAEGEDVGIFKAAGGAPNVEYTFNLNNGEQIFLEPKGGVYILTVGNKVTEYIPTASKWGGSIDSIYLSPIGVTIPEIVINDKPLQQQVYAFKTAGDTMVNDSDLEQALQFNEELSFTGQPLTLVIAADNVELYVQRVGDEILSELTVNEGKAELPNEKGHYMLKAILSLGNDDYVQLISRYRVY